MYACIRIYVYYDVFMAVCLYRLAHIQARNALARAVMSTSTCRSLASQQAPVSHRASRGAVLYVHVNVKDANGLTESSMRVVQSTSVRMLKKP